MKKKIASLVDLAQEVNDALNRATHAQHIHRTVRDMHKFISGKLSLGRDEVEWFYRQGQPSRSVWVTYRGNTYYFHYDPRTEQIEMKENSWQGILVATFSSSTSTSEIINRLSPMFP